MGLLEKIFGNYSEKEIKRITPIVDKIDALAPEFEKLSEEEILNYKPKENNAFTKVVCLNTNVIFNKING